MAVDVLQPMEMEFGVQDLLHFQAPLPTRVSPCCLRHLESRRYVKSQCINIEFAFNIYYSNELPRHSFTALHRA